MHERLLKNILIAARLRHEGKSRTQIAQQLGISTASVSRLLQRVPEFVELRYSVPADEDFEAKLTGKYHLADAIVVETGDERSAVEVVGHAAAAYFMQNVKDESRIALSCGETLLKMLQAMPLQPKLRLTISQISVEADPASVHQAPSTLVGLLRAKVSPRSDALGVQLPPPRSVKACKEFRHQLKSSALLQKLKKRALEADMLLLGIGILVRRRGDSKNSFLEMAEAATECPFSQYVSKLSLVGEINNQVYDAKGQDRTGDIPGLADHIMNVLSLAEIKTMAENRARRKVIAVATGKQKARAIRTALEAGFANVLITGTQDAARLLA